MKRPPVHTEGLLLRRFVTCLTLTLTAACGGSSTRGTFELPSPDARRYQTAYIAAVVADPDGDDLEWGAGEHVVIRNNWDHRADLGGWWIEDDDGNRLRLGFGRQLDPDAELRVHTPCGEDSDEAVFACLYHEVLNDDTGVLRLVDANGNDVARFGYGTSGE